MALGRNRSALCDVPVELLDEIVSLASDADLIALCRVCKSINLCSTRFLYRDVDLETLPRIVNFCKTLLCNKRAALSVRALFICIGTPGIKLKAFWDIFLAGLKSATEIVDLQFDGNAPDFISASCNHALYPRLRILSDQSQFTPPHIISFLRFHPTVEQLHLYHKFDISNQTPLPPTGVVLPCLKFYEGPSHIAHLIIPGSKVSEARIWWGFHPDDPSDFDLVLRSLAKSSVPLTTLVCVGHCWKLEFLPFLAKYMTDVERLDFVTGGATVPADVFTEALRPVVERLTHLQTVKLISRQEEEPTIADLDSDYKTLLTWGYLRPSLIIVRFPSTITWFRYNTKIWLPNVTEHQVLCRDWISHTVEKRLFINLADFFIRMKQLQGSDEKFKEFLVSNAALSCPLQFNCSSEG